MSRFAFLPPSKTLWGPRAEQHNFVEAKLEGNQNPNNHATVAATVVPVPRVKLEYKVKIITTCKQSQRREIPLRNGSSQGIGGNLGWELLFT
jgi:hypothetical protein